MKNLLIAICLLAGLTSCHHDDDDEPVDNRDRRTVLVYIAAENNLSIYANSDLDEMKEGSKKLADDQNLIVYVDEAGSLTTPYIARVKGGELCSILYSTPAKSILPRATVSCYGGTPQDGSSATKTLSHPRIVVIPRYPRRLMAVLLAITPALQDTG